MNKNTHPGKRIKTIPPGKRGRKKRQQSSSAPIIIACSAGGLLFIIFIIVLLNGKSEPTARGGQASTAQITPPNKASTKNNNKKINTTSSKTSAKETTSSNGSKVIDFNKAYTKKPGEEGTPITTQAPANSPVTTTVTTTPTIKKEPTSTSKTSGSAKEQSLANLKAIGIAYKEYSDSHDGHMPIELYQLSLKQSILRSPYTSKEYTMEQAGKGSFLREAQDNIIVREASAVDGKYLCLFGNGTIKELPAAEVE